jgi:hypothetical protein
MKKLFLTFALAGCAHLPTTGLQPSGDLLQVVQSSHQVHYAVKQKVGEVEYRDPYGRIVGTSNVYEDRLVTQNVLTWYPRQGQRRLDDYDFFRISGDEQAAQEISDYRNSGIVMNRVGLSMLGAGALTVAIGFALSLLVPHDTSVSPFYYVSTAGGLVAGTGGLLTWLGFARNKEDAHPIDDVERATADAEAYNEKLARAQGWKPVYENTPPPPRNTASY